MNEPSHAIYQAILLDADSPLKKIKKGDAEINCESELDWYIYGCSTALSSTSGSIEKIEIAILMLDKAKEFIPKDSPYNPYEHIEYAIENYLIRSVGVYDRSLIFVNKLLNIGITDENITHVPIVTNEHVKQYVLDKKLKAFRKVCTENATVRNTIIHHNRHIDDSFADISLLHKTNQMNKELGKRPFITKKIVDGATKQAVTKKVIEYNKHLHKIVTSLNELYDHALPVYHEIKKRYK